MWKRKLDCGCKGKKKLCGERKQLTWEYTVSSGSSGMWGQRCDGGSRWEQTCSSPDKWPHINVYSEMLIVYSLRNRKQYWWRRPEEGLWNKLNWKSGYSHSKVIDRVICMCTVASVSAETELIYHASTGCEREGNQKLSFSTKENKAWSTPWKEFKRFEKIF